MLCYFMCYKMTNPTAKILTNFLKQSKTMKTVSVYQTACVTSSKFSKMLRFCLLVHVERIMMI